VLLVGAVLLLNSGQRTLSKATSDLVVLGVLLIPFCAAMIYLAGPMTQGLWAGYVYFTLLVLLLVFEPAAAFVMLTLGTAAGIGLLAATAQSRQRGLIKPVSEYLARLGTAGSALIVGYIAMDVLKPSRPFTDFGDLNSLLRILLVMQLVYGALLLLSAWVVQSPMRHVWDHVRRIGIIDATFQFAALTVPFALYTGGLTPTLIVLVLILFQAVRFREVKSTLSQLDHNKRDISALSSVGRAISTGLELEEVFTQVHTRLGELISAAAVTSVLYNEAHDLIEYPAVTTAQSVQKPHKRRLGRGLIDWVIRHRQPLKLNAQTRDNLTSLDIDWSQVNVQAFVGVPLLVGDTLIGALALSHDADPHAFDDLDVAVLQTIAAQVALAIRNANLYSRTLRLSNNMAIINQSMQQVLFNLDRDNLIQTACQIACQVTDSPKAAVFLAHEHLGMKLAGHIGMEALAAEDVSVHYRPDRCQSGPYVEADIDNSSDPELRALAQRGGFRAVLEVPMRSSSMLVGVLAVYRDMPYLFDHDDATLLEMLGSQVIAALDNTDLLQALEIYASEQAQLVYLSRVSSTNLDLEQVVLDLSNILPQMIGLPRVDVGLLSSEEVMDVYRPQAAGRVTVERLTLRGLPEIAAAVRNSQIANPVTLNSSDEHLSPAVRQYLSQHEMSVLMLMPMVVNEQVFGLLMLSANTPITITDTMRRLLEMAIHQVSAQVHNARLYTVTEETLSQQLEQLSLIEDLSQKISQSLNVPTIADNVLDAVLRATHADQAEILLKDSQRGWRVFRELPAQLMTVRVVREEELPLEAQQLAAQDSKARETVTAADGRQVVVMPLLSGERMLGMLRIVGGLQSRLGVKELNFIRSLVGHTAVSIDNAFLLEERQLQVNALARLRELSLQVASSSDDQRITELILEAALALLGGSEAALYAYDARTDELVPTAGMLCMHDGYKPMEPRLATEPLYEAVTSGRLVTVHPSEVMESDAHDNLLYPTIVAMPIRRHSEVTEVLAVGFRSQRVLEQRDLNFAELLMVQVANHLENVTLNRTLRTANKQMRAILDSTRDGIILLDNFGRILDANVQASHLLDVELNQAVGEPFTRFLRQHYANTPLEAQMLTLGTELMGSYRELELAHGDTTVYLQISMLPVRDADGASLGRLLLLRDISEDKQLALLRESLQRMVIHDLRSPLGALITGLSFLQSLVDELDSEIAHDMRRTLDASLESAENLMRLMDTLRDIPRMKDIKLDLQPIHFKALVMKAYEMLETLFVEAKIQFDVLADTDIQITVDVDLMRRVLVNLLHNALKFTPEGGKVLVSAETDAEAGLLRVHVCDTGPGIPPAMRDRIFGEFQQIEGLIPKRGGRGTGLGLTLCKLAVEAHGGRIWVDDHGLLPGACFTFTLPLSPVQDLQQANPLREE